MSIDNLNMKVRELRELRMMADELAAEIVEVVTWHIKTWQKKQHTK